MSSYLYKDNRKKENLCLRDTGEKLPSQATFRVPRAYLPLGTCLSQPPCVPSHPSNANFMSHRGHLLWKDISQHQLLNWSNASQVDLMVSELWASLSPILGRANVLLPKRGKLNLKAPSFFSLEKGDNRNATFCFILCHYLWFLAMPSAPLLLFHLL